MIVAVHGTSNRNLTGYLGDGKMALPTRKPYEPHGERAFFAPLMLVVRIERRRSLSADLNSSAVGDEFADLADAIFHIFVELRTN